jgi:hypothetical protein
MEKLFELAIAIGMSLFAFRIGSEGMRRLEIGEKPQAYTIFALSAAILAVQVAVVLSAFNPDSVSSFAGEVRDAAQSVAPAEAEEPVANVRSAKNSKTHLRHHQHPDVVEHPVVSADD